MKTLIEIHVLQNFAPSNLNRSDTGEPKNAMFGGTRRARISSQCLKRAVRQYFKALVENNRLDSADVAFRTKRLLEALSAALEAKGRPKEEAGQKICAALATMELVIKEDEKSQYLLFLGEREILAIANIIHEKWDDLLISETPAQEGKKAPKAKKQAASAADPELKKALEKVMDGGKALDIALFGRMLADMPAKNQDAACQVAHALSTHAVEREFDFYTAVDDLKPEDTSGADMIGTVEFNSACFYRYAALDWAQLVSNLQSDTALAERGLKAFLEGFISSEPSGKQNSFAAHNPPEFIAITIRKNGGSRNLANAFESAIRVRKDESLTAISAKALMEKAVQLKKVYGGNEQTFLVNLTNAQVDGFGSCVDTLDSLLSESLRAVLDESRS